VFKQRSLTKSVLLTGFYGELCNKCISLPGCHHGYCNTSFECNCHKGWDGLFCRDGRYHLNPDFGSVCFVEAVRTGRNAEVAKIFGINVRS